MSRNRIHGKRRFFRKSGVIMDAPCPGQFFQSNYDRTRDCCLIMELCVNLDSMHFLSRVILKRSSQPCGVGVKVDLWAGFGSSASVPTLAGSVCKTSYKCQVLGMLREVMAGGRFGTNPSCIFGVTNPSSSWNSLPVSC